jgi:hypothetical protein
VSPGCLWVAPAGFTTSHKLLSEFLIECDVLSKHFTKDVQRDQKGDKATWDLHQWSTNVYNETNLDNPRYNMKLGTSLGLTAYADGE